MLRRYRHRRGPYAVAAPSSRGPIIRKVIWYGIFLLLLYWIGSRVVGWIGGGNAVDSRPVMMTTEEGGRSNVSFDGGLLQPAESGINLHPGDRIVTADGHVRLQFFDQTRMRMDAQSDLTIRESEEGLSLSSMDVRLDRGALWVRTPAVGALTSDIERTISVPAFTLTLPANAEAVVEQDGIIVFSAAGQGVTMHIAARNQTIVIGEGQQIRFPDGTNVEGDLLRFRSAINPLAVQRSFVEDSRRLAATADPVSGGTAEGTSDLLVVRTPGQDAVVEGRTVLVDGTVDRRVDRVRVNGYLASINREDGSFQQELSLREGETSTTIRIEALDARGLALAETTRTVRIVEAAPVTGTPPSEGPVPTITAPAQTGQTFRTQQTELVIRGTAPPNTQAIIVNDYQLQLFQPGNPTWSYLANATLGNMRQGSNVYNVYAVDAAGNRSAPATITILLEAGTQGVVQDGQGTTTPPPAQPSETTLPTNDPLLPGTITVTAPQAGSTYTATGTGFLLEGTTSSQTASVWVNGYRLQLYVAGRTNWNYIANTALGTLVRGTNTYRIVARNAQNQILDTFTYTVEYESE